MTKRNVFIGDPAQAAVTNDIIRQRLNPAIEAICEDFGGASSVSVCTMIVQMLVVECAALHRDATWRWLASLCGIVHTAGQPARLAPLEKRRKRAVAEIHAAARPGRRP